ncbi:hypothetical protein Tco_0689424 [Tanacetum coccineum]
MNLGHQFDNAITAKDELRKAYEECRDIPLVQRALIENFLKIESKLDQQMQNALFRKVAKLEKKSGIKISGYNNCRLPVKSLLQFRTVSKQWKFSIDNFEFIHENLAFRHMDSNLNIFSLTPVASSEDMPEHVRVGEFSPPYYISQLGDSLIISRSFDFGDCRIIYAWALEVKGGFV